MVIEEIRDRMRRRRHAGRPANGGSKTGRANERANVRTLRRRLGRFVDEMAALADAFAHPDALTAGDRPPEFPERKRAGRALDPKRLRRSILEQIDELSDRADLLSARIHDEMRGLKRNFVDRWVLVNGRRPQQLPQAITTRLDAFSAQVDAFTARFDQEVDAFRRLLRENPERRGGRIAQIPNTLLGQFEDELRFLRSWTDNPLTVGAVSPSSPVLGQIMAEFVDIDRAGIVIELGPGTGAVTAALIDHGIAPERIVAIEYDGAFCALLQTRFPGITVIEGDAYDLQRTLRGNGVDEPVASVVSSLPLLTQPMPQRTALIDQSLDLMPDGAPFIQFCYALTPPVPGRRGRWSVTGSKRVWRNLPPARVWCYRRA